MSGFALVTYAYLYEFLSSFVRTFISERCNLLINPSQRRVRLEAISGEVKKLGD